MWRVELKTLAGASGVAAVNELKSDKRYLNLATSGFFAVRLA